MELQELADRLSKCEERIQSLALEVQDLGDEIDDPLLRGDNVSEILTTVEERLDFLESRTCGVDPVLDDTTLDNDSSDDLPEID